MMRGKKRAEREGRMRRMVCWATDGCWECRITWSRTFVLSHGRSFSAPLYVRGTDFATVASVAFTLHSATTCKKKVRQRSKREADADVANL